MGLGPAAVKIYLELWQQGHFEGIRSMAEMGSQEIHLKKESFEALLGSAGLDNYRKENFRNLEFYPGAPRVAAKYFYEALGVNNYACVDLNGDHQAVKIDLNEPLKDKSLYAKFDLVTDHGTNEHVFNVAEAYRSMHRLAKPGGILSVIQAVYRGNGYYLFDQSFFEGIAAANNYRILFSSYVITIPDQKDIYSQFHIPASAKLLEVLDWAKLSSVEICYVFRKQEEADFVFPYQGSYLSKAQGNLGYKLQFLAQPPSYSYLPLFSRDLEEISAKSLARILLKRLVRRLRGRKH